ncbi:MAG: hypothetical protein AAF657_37580, partial [Acidobacteriota bacterium]
MALKFSEMIALRTDLALSLEAGFDNYLEEVAGGYGDYLAPVLDEGEPAIDARFQMVLLRRSVERHRNRLDNLDEGVIGQSHDDEKVRAEINQQRDAVDNKLRLVRSTCRGIFGPESLARVGLKGIFPRGPARLLRFGLVVRASLENPDLGLEPLLDLDAGADEATPSASVRLAAQLDPELSRLGELVNRRHQQRRRTVAIRLGRQEVIREFDSNIRGIVRMAQGMFRLAGRNDLGLRFRPILQRALRRLKSEEGESGASQTSGEVEGSEVEPG